MKNILLTLTIALAGLTAAQAQDQQGRRQPGQRPDSAQMAQQRTDRMADRYNLDNDQKARLLDLNKKYTGLMMPMRGGAQPGRGMRPGQPGQQAQPGQPDGRTGASAQAQPRGQKQKGNKDKRDALREYEDDLEDILTDEQWQTYRRERMQPSQVTSRLQLTKKQAKKVAKLNKKYEGKLPDENARPEGQPGQPGGQRPPRMSEEQRQQMEAQRQAYEKELQAILTEEQWQRYQSDRQQRGPRQRGPQPGGQRPD